MSNLFVVDTCALISYFSTYFNNSQVSISKRALRILDKAFQDQSVNLIFPAVIFIELFEKWFRDAEASARIRSEIYIRIKGQPNMEIQPLDKEILTNFILIDNRDRGYNFDNRDKQILASAITMDCGLITSDTRIIGYNNETNIVKKIIS